MAIPLLNERDRRGTKIRVSTADMTTIARLTPSRTGVIYGMFIRIVGVRVLSAASATQPAGYVYWRYCAFITSAAGVVSQIGSTETIGTDKETDSAASVLVSTDGTNINIQASAAYPTDWSVSVDTDVNDQVLVG